MCAERSLEEIARPDMDRFDCARFGMFIHWGLYALGARHEWLKSRERMSDEACSRGVLLRDSFLQSACFPRGFLL